MSESDRWRREKLTEAVGRLPDRGSSQETGVDDLLALADLAAPFGREFDADITAHVPRIIETAPALLEAIDPECRLGSVARKRIESAHNLALAGLICAVEPLVEGRLPHPCGIRGSSWTFFTGLSSSTPGVTVLDDGRRSITIHVISIVGGEASRAYALPLWIEPAVNPTDPVAVALEQLQLGLAVRARVRHYVSQVGHVPLGSLPVLAGRIRPAVTAAAAGTPYGRPTAVADSPLIIDFIEEQTEEGVPILFQFGVGEDGMARVPDGWWLDLSQRAGAGVERPQALHGLGMAVRENVLDVLQSSRHPYPLMRRLGEVPGVARVLRGGLVAQGTCRPMVLWAVHHLSLARSSSLAVTNFGSDARGMVRLGMAVEGLFGSAIERATCRRRAAGFISRIQINASSARAMRNRGGIAVMAFGPTVLDRVGSPR